MKSYLIFAGVLLASFFVGVFGFSQIIGSLQNVKTRGIGLSLFTITLWAAILVGTFFLMKKFIPDEAIAYYIGMGVSFVVVLAQGRIQ